MVLHRPGNRTELNPDPPPRQVEDQAAQREVSHGGAS